jgi:hypothetical protein
MAPLQTLFPRATQNAKDALRFYEQNYSTIRQWILKPGKKVILAASQPGACRFCCLRAPEVTFKSEAHAIPECTGNKSLTTEYECDDCNRFFGTGIENDFGAWTKAQRALSGVRGKKNRVPALKEESRSRQWRLEHDATGLKLTHDKGDPIVVVNETTKQITLTVPCDPYTPVAVLKAFTKMALSLLPEEELPNLQDAMAWIRNVDHQADPVKLFAFPVLYTFVPGNNPFDTAVMLLRRRTDDLPVPYLSFVLSYGNEMFQTILPSPQRDAAIGGQKIKFPYFPTAFELDCDLAQVAPLRREAIDLTGCSLLKGEMMRTVMRYE